MARPEYTLTELMAVTAAREIEDGEVVFAGTGLPMLGAMLAQRTHAPNCIIIFEAGTMASQLAHLPMSVGDPRVMRGAATAAGLFEVFTYVLQAGRVDVGFLSGAQVDRFGNINSTTIGSDPRHPRCVLGQRRFMRHRLPGQTHDHHRHTRKTALPRKGRLHYQPRLAGRRKQPANSGLIRGGPRAVVTTKGVMRFRPDTHSIYLASYHPGLTARAVAEATGFPLDIEDAAETAPPTRQELRILREVVDPEGILLR